MNERASGPSVLNQSPGRKQMAWKIAPSEVIVEEDLMEGVIGLREPALES